MFNISSDLFSALLARARKGGGGGSATLIEKSISANGVYNASEDSADGYSKVTVNVPSGGGTSQPRKDVNFYDYDGTVVNSYTAAEFANLSAMPSNPSHEGLTAQGWNWSLSDAKTYVASYGKLNIGQMYITSDGKTRLYITLTEGRTSPYLKLYLNANTELDVDWGDSTNHSVFTTSSEGLVTKQHEYSSAGNYIIVITVISGSFEFKSSTSNISTLLSSNNGVASSPDRCYLNSIKKVEIGSSMTAIRESAFNSCNALRSVTIPYAVTEIEKSAFQTNSSLIYITLPNTITDIGNNMFRNCNSLETLSIPKSVTSIGMDAFSSCFTLNEITLPNTVTNISSSCFNNCVSLSIIKIPSSVTSIGTNAFTNCHSLATITIDKAEGSITGSPWGASTSSPTSTQIIWTG